MKTYHKEDDLMEGITFQELITTVHCNEQRRDRATIEKVFNQIMAMKISDARVTFDHYFKDIQKEG